VDAGLGWGSGLAPLGSVEHAKRWRLDMQSAVDRMSIAPETIEALFTVGNKHRVWTLLTSSTGKAFATFDAFCEAPRPHGLGIDESAFDPVARLVRAVQRLDREEHTRVRAALARLRDEIDRLLGDR
jgi:hypothetical protein